jgi:hypothetical protein
MAALGAMAGHALREGEVGGSVLAGVAFGAIDFALVAAILLALGIRRRGAPSGAEAVGLEATP